MDLADLQHPIVADIYKSYEEANAKEPKRGYLGASIIGSKCERYLWYVFRECAVEKFSGRMLRLFNTGDREESRMVEDLRAIGCEVHPFAPISEDFTSEFPELMPHQISFLESQVRPKQWEILDYGDHFSGHLDAIIINIGPIFHEWYIGEFKTHNKKSFEDLKAKRVKISKPLHYAQMQVYMHKMDMEKALYLAVLKDTDELYAEIVEYNKDDAEALMLKAKRIITAATPPPRYSKDRNTFLCTYCSANSVCWGNVNLAKPEDALPYKSCRQCKNSWPDIEHTGANWYCRLSALVSNGKMTPGPCKLYTLIPVLLHEEPK